MAKIKQQVIITGEELKDIICKIYNLDLKDVTFDVKYIPANQMDSEYLEVIINSTKHIKTTDLYEKQK